MPAKRGASLALSPLHQRPTSHPSSRTLQDAIRDCSKRLSRARSPVTLDTLLSDVRVRTVAAAVVDTKTSTVGISHLSSLKHEQRTKRLCATVLRRLVDDGFLLPKDAAFEVATPRQTAKYIAALLQLRPVDRQRAPSGRPFTGFEIKQRLSHADARYGALTLGTVDSALALLAHNGLVERYGSVWQAMR